MTLSLASFVYGTLTSLLGVATRKPGLENREGMGLWTAGVDEVLSSAIGSRGLRARGCFNSQEKKTTSGVRRGNGREANSSLTSNFVLPALYQSLGATTSTSLLGHNRPGKIPQGRTILVVSSPWGHLRVVDMSRNHQRGHDFRHVGLEVDCCEGRRSAGRVARRDGRGWIARKKWFVLALRRPSLFKRLPLLRFSSRSDAPTAEWIDITFAPESRAKWSRRPGHP